jgi:hypothetical protein
MKIERLRRILSSAKRVDGLYMLDLEPHDFNVLCDLADEISGVRITRITTAAMLRALPPAL